VLCSYEDAYGQIDYLENAVIETGAKIAILCAGPTATCLAWRLSKLGIQALDLGHIGQFWRQGTPSIPSLAPTNVLPAVQLTKASIKAWGAIEQHGPIWWPVYDRQRERNIIDHDAGTGWISDIRPRGKNNEVCIIANAHYGINPTYLSTQFRRVYAFEPDFGLFGSLRRNIVSDNIFFYKEALGDKVGIIRMMPSTTPGQWRKADDGTVTVLQVTIDSMDLDACDAIVIDGTASEQAILDGAQKTIARFAPAIYLKSERAPNV
jgi:FkbM family methyltransferase